MKLTVENLSFERNYQHLFEKVNFELSAGELLQISGANGCGKTTLLRLLAGLIYAEEGKILWNGHNVFNDLKNYQREINYIGHQNGIKLYLNTEENIHWFELLCESNEIASAQKTCLAMTSLASQKNSSLRGRKPEAIHLSAGQKRRLALTRLLINPAKLWILDEPTTALDHQGQILFFSLLEKHISNGGIGIITTHHPLPQTLHPTKIHLGEKNA